MLLVKIHMEDLFCIAFFMLGRKNESIHHEKRRKYAFDPLFKEPLKKKGLADRVVVGKNDWTVKTKVQYHVGLICHNNKIFWHCPYHFSMQVLEHAAL